MEDYDGWKISQVIGWAFMGILGWLGARSINRLDKLEREYVTREDLNDAIDLMRNERLLMHQENRDRLKTIDSKLDESSKEINQIAVNVAKLAARNHR